MNTETYNIPLDDVECWVRYPKHRWVYDMSRLLDIQNIHWSPFATDISRNKVKNINFKSLKDISYDPGYIYITDRTGTNIISEVFIIKGTIKLIKYFNKITCVEIQESIGDIELRINAFVSMHFHKFTGIISVESIGDAITAVRLRRHIENYTDTTSEAFKLTKKIYKKTD